MISKAAKWCLNLFFVAFAFYAKADPKDFFSLENLDKIEFYLITIGRSPDPHALFGHTILRVVNTETKNDLNFNWGIFDFDSPFFVWTFYRGDLDYRMALTDFQSLLDHYRVYERRLVIQDHLNLTSLQKKALAKRLADNAKPENIYYKYFQFYDNCATRVRDHLDSALSGHLQTFFADKFSPVSFRDLIRRNASPSSLIRLGLDISSNDRLDKRIALWEEMFLPQNMRQLLLEAPAFADDGTPIYGKNLLDAHQILVDFPEPEMMSSIDASLALMFGMSILISFLLFVKFQGSTSLRRFPECYLGIVTLLFSLWTSFWGSLMAFNWGLSYYQEVQHNALLWIMYPFDWILAFYGWILLRGRRKYWPRLEVWSKRLALVHIIAFFILATGWFFHLIQQDVSTMLVHTGLSGLFLYVMLVWMIVPDKQEA